MLLFASDELAILSPAASTSRSTGALRLVPPLYAVRSQSAASCRLRRREEVEGAPLCAFLSPLHGTPAAVVNKPQGSYGTRVK